MVYNIVGEGFRILLQNGLVDILIFALIFAVVFGVLQNVKMFGEDEETSTKKYNAVISLALAGLSILPHYVMRGSRYDVVEIVSNAIPQTMMILVMILGVLILLGMFGWNLDKISDPEKSSWIRPIIALAMVGIVIWIFVRATGNRLPYWLSYDVLSIVVALGVFGGIIYFVMGGNEDD